MPKQRTFTVVLETDLTEEQLLTFLIDSGDVVINIKEGDQLHTYDDFITQDILMMAESYHIDLDDEQLSKVLELVKDYDYAHFNDYIIECIYKIIPDEE